MINISVISIVLLILTIYYYLQNRTLIKNLNKELEIESNKQSFLETLIHDLKSPTNAQLNALNMLKNESFGQLNPQQREMISLTQESCKYMSNLIGTIMTTYSCDSGKIKLQKTDFDLVELIINICNEEKSLMQKKNLLLDFYKNEECIKIYADKLQLERVIHNLISNAITYSFAKTIIEINLTESKGNVEFVIKNQSNQIPETELKTVFDKYSKTKISHFNKASTGLGLYLSKQVIQMHRGKIYAKSYQDGICEFGFILPKFKRNLKEKFSSTAA